MKSPLRVLRLVPYPLGTAPGQRYRIEQWAPYLREEGIDIHFEPFAGPAVGGTLYRPGQYATKAWHMTRAWLHRARTAWRGSGFDVVYLYREAALIGPAWLERLAAGATHASSTISTMRSGCPTSARAIDHLSYLKAPAKTAGICEWRRPSPSGTRRSPTSPDATIPR